MIGSLNTINQSTPIGLDVGLFYPSTTDHTVAKGVNSGLAIIALVLWIIVFAGIARDKLYTDENQIIFINIGISNLVVIVATLHSDIMMVANGGFDLGFWGCTIQAYTFSVAWISLGLSSSALAMDRYLLIRKGFEKSKTKTTILVGVAWFVSLFFPALFIFTNLPDSVALYANTVCFPNFLSLDYRIYGYLYTFIIFVFLSQIIQILCYADIYYFYLNSLRKRNPQPTAPNPNMKSISFATPKPAIKLLKKFAVVNAHSLIFVTPLVCIFCYMLITRKEASWPFFYAGFYSYEIMSVLNPLVMYYMDAHIRNSVDAIFLDYLGWDARSRGKRSEKAPSDQKLDVQVDAPRDDDVVDIAVTATIRIKSISDLRHDFDIQVGAESARDTSIAEKFHIFSF